jgi:hypothetical protein
MTKLLSLTGQFDVPGYRTGLEVLVLLAEAVDGAFSSPGAVDLLDASEKGDWIDLLFLLGNLNVDSKTKVSDTKNIGDLWDAYLGTNDLKILEPRVLAVFQKARRSSIARATADGPIVNYLDAANRSGHNIAREILKKYGLATLLPSSRVPVEVFYDGTGETYCAGSHLWTNEIRWAYQALEQALPGVVVSEFVFAHEYLSHLAPQNKYLNSTIREQWLVAALRHGLETDKLGPYWKIRLWPRYRTALESHVTGLAKILQPDASPVRYSGLRGAEEALRSLSLMNPSLFEKLTREILASKDDTKLTTDAMRVAKALTYRGLPAVPRNNSLTISSLADILDPPKP